MSDINKLIGARIEKFRKKSKISQADVGEMLDLSRVSIYNMEIGKHKCSLENLYKIAAILGVTTHDLLPVDYKPKIRVKLKKPEL